MTTETITGGTGKFSGATGTMHTTGVTVILGTGNVVVQLYKFGFHGTITEHATLNSFASRPVFKRSSRRAPSSEDWRCLEPSARHPEVGVYRAGMTPASSRMRVGGRCCSVTSTPRWASASSMALVMAGGAPIMPPSPTPR